MGMAALPGGTLDGSTIIGQEDSREKKDGGDAEKAAPVATSFPNGGWRAWRCVQTSARGVRGCGGSSVPRSH